MLYYIIVKISTQVQIISFSSEAYTVTKDPVSNLVDNLVINPYIKNLAKR